MSAAATATQNTIGGETALTFHLPASHRVLAAAAGDEPAIHVVGREWEKRTGKPSAGELDVTGWRSLRPTQ
jgi:hypothetical protein